MRLNDNVLDLIPDATQAVSWWPHCCTTSTSPAT